MFNFLKFVDWPDDPAKDPPPPWVLGVVGDPTMGEDLKQLVSGKFIRGRELVVKNLAASADLRGCSILFIGVSERSRLTQILAGLQGASVLTVADMDNFIGSGGMIQFVVEDVARARGH